jgi:hypothetical protein
LEDIDRIEELTAQHIAVPEFNLILRHLQRRRALLEAHCPLLAPLRALVSTYDMQFPGHFHPRIEAMLLAEDQAQAANGARSLGSSGVHDNYLNLRWRLEFLIKVYYISSRIAPPLKLYIDQDSAHYGRVRVRGKNAPWLFGNMFKATRVSG